MAKTRSWSVKGIDGGTRDLARDAARASGITIGAWIDQAIVRAKRNDLPAFAPAIAKAAEPTSAPAEGIPPEAIGVPAAAAPPERPTDIQSKAESAAPAGEIKTQTVSIRSSGDNSAPREPEAGRSTAAATPLRDISVEPRPLPPPAARPSALRYALLGLVFAIILGGGGWLFLELSSPDRTPAPRKITDAAPAVEAPPPPSPAVSSTTAPVAPAPPQQSATSPATASDTDARTAELPEPIQRIIVEARAGNPEAQYNMGMLHLSGRLGEKSTSEAAKWFGRAAEQGIAIAQFNLGVLYQRGEGVAQNDKQAFFWYQSAAEQNYPQAQHNLATAYAEGQGIAPNYPKAAEWFAKSAEAGLSQSQFSLGALHERGLITGQPNPAEARRWYERALAQGDTRASERLAALDAATPPATTVSSNAATGAVDAAENAIGRTEIRQIQALLNRMNFNPGPSDGQMGKRTADAIRLYQKFAGMEEDGVPSQELLEDLRAVADSMSKGG